MKKLILLLAITAIAFNSNVNARENHPVPIRGIKLFKHIDVTFTSTGGCKFHVVGEVSGGIFSTPTFSGNITISGPSGCPKGTFSFALAVSPEDPNKLKLVSGDESIFKLIESDPRLETDMANYFTANNN